MAKKVKLTIKAFLIGLVIFAVTNTNLTAKAEEEVPHPHSIEIIINR